MLPINTTMRAREWGILLILAVLWGGSFFFVEIALRALPPLTIVLCRVGIAALTLWAVVFCLRLPLPQNAAMWASFLLMGFLNNALPFSLIVWGQTHITAGLASILNATTPLFTVFVAACALPDERFSLGKLIGILCGIAGVAVMLGLDAPADTASGTAPAASANSILAMLAVCGAAFAYGCANAFGRRYRRWNIHPIVTAAGQVSGATLLLLPLAFVIDAPQNLPLPSTQVMLAVIAIAVLSTALAYILYFHMLATAGATNISLVTFLVPVSAILLGILFLGESLTPPHIAGMALIALGLLAIDGRLQKRLRQFFPSSS